MSGITTGLDRRSAMPHVWEGRPSDLPFDIAYAFTDDKLKANWRQLMEAIAQTLITGIMCVEGTVAYGASTTTHCRLTLPNGWTELNDYLIIGDGSRVWRVKILVANEIDFTDTHLISGTPGTADYNTIQNNLRIVTLSKEKIGIIITKNEISLGAFDDALHGDDMRISKAIATTIKDLYDAFDLEHESNGKHSDGIIENSMLDKNDVLITQGFTHLVINGDFCTNKVASLDHWDTLGTPATLQANENSPNVFPSYECQIASDDIDEGIRQYFPRGEVGMPLRLCFWAKGDSGGEKLKVLLSDGVDNSPKEITLTNSWTKYYHGFTPTTKMDLSVRFISNIAGTQTMRLGLITLAPGDVHTLPEPSPYDALFDAVHTKVFYIPDLQTASDEQYAEWVAKRDFKIIRCDAYAHVAPNVEVTVRLTNQNADDYDVGIATITGKGINTSESNLFEKDDVMQIFVLDNASTSGSEISVVFQYKQM